MNHYLSISRLKSISYFILSCFGLFMTAIPLVSAGEEDKSTPVNETIEEVVVIGMQVGYYDESAVSALKQSVRLIETPLSVFVINDELIADQQSFRLDQILQNDSSVQKSNNFLGAYSSYKIRGFDLDNGANYLRDGRSFFHLAAPPTEILERVEVLKGPSSVLYGTMAPGGLINMTSKKPLAETAGSVKVTVGSYDLMHLHLDVGGSVNESGTLRYRANVATENSKSFRRFFNGEEFKTERGIYSLAVAWDVFKQTTLTVNHDNTDDERPQDNGLIGDEDGLSDILPYEMIYNQPWSHYNSNVTNTLVELDHKFNDYWDLKAGYSYQSFERDRYDNQLRDFDEETGDNEIRARRRLNQRDYETYFVDVSTEFVTGNFVHNILFGYDTILLDRNDREVQNADRVTFTSNIFGEAFPDPQIAIGDRLVKGEEDREGYYFQDMMEIGEKWRILVGGRYDDYQTSISDDYSITNFTPRTGVLYLPNDNLSFYSSYSESFEPNGPVSSDFDNAGEQLDPTVGDMLEIGTKWETFDGNLLVTGAVFTIERGGSPLEDTITNTIEQRGLQEHKGVELTVSGLVGESLSLIASGTYLDAEIVADDNLDLIGNTPSGVSDVALSLWAEYQLENGLSLQCGFFYESGRPVDDNNTFDLDGYYRADVGAKYEYNLINGQSLISRLTVSNIFDEEYYKANNANSINPERPREVRASLQYSF